MWLNNLFAHFSVLTSNTSESPIQMYSKYLIHGQFVMVFSILLCGCVQRKAIVRESPFTKIDSLTEQYLELQDSMHQAWNIMIHDDNFKIKTMHGLLQELKISNQCDMQTLGLLEQRISELKEMRYDQKTIVDADVIADYDFITNSLITELVSLAESQSDFALNKSLQTLIDEIKAADYRVDNYRHNYDQIALSYNKFLEENKSFIKEIDTHLSADKRPLFHMASGEN